MIQDINRLIDKTHFKSLNHFKDHVKNKYPDITDKELRQIYNDRIKDPYVDKKKISKFQIRIFSNSTNTWFHDIFVNPGDIGPKYFHLFVGTNNRYAVANPLENKNADSIMNSLQLFLDNHKCIKLTSDEESAFLSKTVLEFLKSRKILVNTIPDKNHSALGIIDRLIKTLRDMNTPNEKSKSQSNAKKYKSFTVERMNKLINIYNNTFHSSIKTTPKKMYENRELEEKYILKRLKEREEQRKLQDFELKPGDLVRYILPRHDGINKKRYRYSKEYFKVDSKNGSMYNLIASDGTTIVKPRFLIMKISANEEAKMKLTNTIPGKNVGVIDKVIERMPNGKLKVNFVMPDGTEYEDIIPESYMRNRFNLSGI